MTGMRRLRGAMVGYGHVAAQGHAPVWATREDVAIVAVVDPSPERRERFLASRPGGRAYAAVETLLAEEALDFVDICTPPSSHAAAAEQALAAGLHVLCEKPLAVTAAAALRVAEAAGRAGRVVHVVHNWLAAPRCRQLSAQVDAGAVGAVRRVSWRTLRTRPSVAVGGEEGLNWRLDPAIAGGGVLLDHGWHAAYCVARWAGLRPRRLAARLETRRFHDLAVEDTATVDLDFGRVSGRIFLTWAADERANSVSVEGERGRIEIAGDEVILEDGAGERRWPHPPALSEGSHHPDWFAAVADDFVVALRGRGSANLEEAVLCAELMDAAKASHAAGGGWIAVDAADRAAFEPARAGAGLRPFGDIDLPRDS
jgi:predicted dehydrogenase